MKYKVTGRYIKEKLTEFYRKLTDGTIENQEPDGKEIVASMKRARVGRDGIVCWSETCYCATPLAHERQTVLDHFFTDMAIEPLDEAVDFSGEPFMELLKKASER